MTSGRYVMVAGQTYRIDTLDRVADAHRAMIAAGVLYTPVYLNGERTGKDMHSPKAPRRQRPCCHTGL